MINLAGYLVLFLLVGLAFLGAGLLFGRLFRPDRPGVEKAAPYECGEPAVGTAWVQFDLRFYVVALLFVIFDVELVFLFPWAEVFGKANAISQAAPPQTAQEYRELAAKVLDLGTNALDNPYALPETPPVQAERQWRQLRELSDEQLEWYRSLDQKEKRRLLSMPASQLEEQSEIPAQALRGLSGNLVKSAREEAGHLALVALGELLVFFGVLLVGFAYLWRRGDLVWVRSLGADRAGPPS